MLKLIRKHPEIKVNYSISGVTLDQFEDHASEVLESFQALAATGSVDFLTETYYHSLACVMPGNEFELQIARHQRQVLRHFGVCSSVFRNTELIYNDELGSRINALGFKGTIVDGVDHLPGPNDPHHLFHHPTSDLRLLVRNYRLSDDISFRFSQNGSALTADQYLSWLRAIPPDQDLITLAMDYETFGEHQRKETGIFTFLERLLSDLARSKDFGFMKASEAVEMREPLASLPVPVYISWADQERDLSAWLGNDMQRDAFDSMSKLEQRIKNLHDKALLQEWRTLQTSDHFYYMSTKRGSDGEVHSYFSPYPSPYEAFINYMNVLADLTLKVKSHMSIAKASEPAEFTVPEG